MKEPEEVFEFDVESELGKLNTSYKKILVDKKKKKEYEEALEDLRAFEYKFFTGQLPPAKAGGLWAL